MCFALLLVVAITHKARVVMANGAQTEPVIATHKWAPRVAAAILTAATVLEVAIVAALFADPAIGLIALAMLLLVYTAELRRLQPQESCACLGDLFIAPDRAAAIRRNLFLFATSLALGAGYVAGLPQVAPLSEATIGVAAVIAAAATAGQARSALARSVSNYSMPGGRRS
jgi:hypothetical protein